MSYKYYILLLLLIASPLQAQHQSLLASVSKQVIIYQSPNDGDTYIPQQTTLIIRPIADITRGRSAHDFMFNVRGESSGIHAGKVVISDDNETVIFKPDFPFFLNELVNVKLTISGMENISPISYSFRITSITEEEQIRMMKEFRESEDSMNRSFGHQQIQSGPPDSLPMQNYIVDTLVAGKVAAGDIYAARNGALNYSFVETLDNLASPLYQRSIFLPPAEDFRPWENKYYSYINMGQIILMDLNHKPIDSFKCGNGYITDDHEFRLMPNGHVLLMANESRTTDMRTITGDSTSTTQGLVIGGIIQELDTNKNVVFTWRTWDHFQDTDIVNFDFHDPTLRSMDYCHLNSLDVDTDGNIIASFRNMSEITKINRSNGNIIWRWGGKHNFFKFAAGSVPFSYQHDARRIANGHITMMDNGNFHTTTWGDGSTHDTSWSRAIEYNLDESSLTATPVWEYRKIEYTSAAGNVQRLPNGNTFIFSGNFGVQKAVEVTPDGEKVYQLSFPNGDFAYRMYRFPTPQIGPSAVSEADNTGVFEIRSIYPNPATASATLTYSAKSSGDIQIEVTDILGHSVLKTTEKVAEAGTYTHEFDLHDLLTGIYFCKIAQNGNFAVKMLVVRR